MKEVLIQHGRRRKLWQPKTLLPGIWSRDQYLPAVYHWNHERHAQIDPKHLIDII
jgi:hypothetical protein